MSNRGPKTELTDKLVLEIRKMVLDGKSYVEIQQELEINDSTWDTWVYKNYQGFRNNLVDWKHERILKKCEKLSEEILDINHTGDNGVDSRILSIKQKESEFIRSTLDKKHYSKQLNTELTGKDGEALIITTEEKSKINNIIEEYLNGEN
jgi:hypothetical protein